MEIDWSVRAQKFFDVEEIAVQLHDMKDGPHLVCDCMHESICMCACAGVFASVGACTT